MLKIVYLIGMAQKISETASPEFSVKEQVREPEQYQVILFNDDYTTKDFVVAILKGIFTKSATEAIVLMETIHRSGKAVAGTYCYDIAATKTAQVTQASRSNGFPLKCAMERA